MRTALRCEISSFGVPKAGVGDMDWEDAAAHSERSARFALADGAAAAYQAGVWSHILTSGFLADPFALDDAHEFEAWRARRAQEWLESVEPDEDAPYYIRHAVDRGSFATLLLVELDAEVGFRALAVGDSCLFIVRDGQVNQAFPIVDPDEFGFHPSLVSTAAGDAATLRVGTGQLETGDTLLAASDAMSEWLLRAHNAGDGSVLAGLIDATGSIDDLVRDGRASRALRNDDVAVIRCLVTEPMP